ncbi:hypothetical protein DMP15_29890 [Pseudonocardia sp. UM4_GMWB1]
MLLALVGHARWLLRETEGAEQTTPDDNHADTAADDIRDWADELAVDYQDDVLTPATFALAGLLAAELRAHPSTLALDHRHRLRTTLARVEKLRAALAAAR